jgi:serine/threonine protein kinase
MAPEQFRGEKPQPCMDIYALGILAFEMAAGECPFQNDNVMALQYMHLASKLPELKEKTPDTPGWYQEFVEICASKDPKNRFQSMAEAGEFLFDRLSETGPIPCTLGQGFCPFLKHNPAKKKNGLFGFLR